MYPKQFYVTILVLIASFWGNANAQEKNPILIGLQPSITIEPFYEDGELDINVFPLVLEMPLGQRISFRLLPTVNYHLGGVNNEFSDMGLFTVLPVFLKKRESPQMRPYGFYIGPVLGLGRNFLNKHYTTTIAIEPGYMFEAKKSFTITLGIQLGASHFLYDAQANQWILHWGPKASFSFWL